MTYKLLLSWYVEGHMETTILLTRQLYPLDLVKAKAPSIYLVDPCTHRCHGPARHFLGFTAGHQCRSISVPCTGHRYGHFFCDAAVLGLAFLEVSGKEGK